MKALLLFSSWTLIQAKTADPTAFPACPVNHSPLYFCCQYDQDTQHVFTRYLLPEEFDVWKQGWAQSRQINFPYAKYSPDTPSFQYTDPSTICRIQARVDGNGEIVEKIQCAAENATLLEDSRRSNEFWTFPKNARNNNATCPEGRPFFSLMKDGKLDLEAKARCVSATQAATASFITLTEAPLVLVYLIYGIGLAMIALWAVFKWAKELQLREDAVKQMKPSIDMEAATVSLVVQEPEDQDDISQYGYIDTMVGQVLLYYFIAMSLSLNILMIIVILDYYGIFPTALFLPGEERLAIFISLWAFSAVWYAVIVSWQSKLRNFFRLRVPLKHSTSVHLFKPDETEIMLQDRSGVSEFVQKIERKLMPQHRRGFEQTVPVHETLSGSKVLEFQHLRYYYDEQTDRFVPGVVSIGQTYSDLRAESQGLSTAMQLQRLDTVGPNRIEIEMPPMVVSVVGEFFTFFYIYQIMCYYVWFYGSYWNMGLVMIVVVAASAVINIATKRRMQASVVKMTKYSTLVQVNRNGEWIKVDSQDLVPGDLARVQDNWTLPCDLVILQGATVCDESMLTGESTPVQKFPIPHSSEERYDALGAGKKHTLFNGARVLSCASNEETVALVKATGAQTSKGKLIQNILYPIPMRFKYDEHLKVVLSVLLVYGLVSSYFVLEFLTSNGNLTNKLNAWAYCIFMISGVLSPLLPVVITFGQVNASNRLEKLGVFCLNAQRITLSGKIRIFCFDKTGTLTKDGLDFLGCKTLDHQTNRFHPDIITDVGNPDALDSDMTFALASCHAVGYLNGELVGSQVEVNMFKATGWKLIEAKGQEPIVATPDGSIQLQVVKRFEFDHHRMSMSVIMRDLRDGSLYIFCKGSYEKMKHLSRSESLPSDYTETAERLARDGCYVLGLAIRKLGKLEDDELTALVSRREAVEQDLSMLGLMMFRNELKPDTRQAIQRLKAGDIRVVMITGDNAMCGCYIARESGMVSPEAQVILGDMAQGELKWANVDTGKVYSDQEVVAMASDVELAVTGPAFDYLVQHDKMARILLQTRIFSRMTPDGKSLCVKMHMDTGAITGMCGDGGNDCGALRMAHAGVSLSNAEASIVSPFTSKTKTVTSVVDLCREGRCSVATSFASVKMLIMYGLVASTLRFIQYYNGIILAEWCWILADGFILVGLSYAITLSGPLPELGTQRPTSSLVGPNTVLSIVGQELINVIFLYFSSQYLVNQPWYCPFTPDNVDLAKWWLLSDNALATCVFYCVVVQQQTAALVFSFGSVYRQPIWRNYFLCLFLAMLLVLDFYLILGEPSVVTDLFRVASGTNVVGLPEIPLSFDFRVKYLLFSIGNMLAVVFYEYVVVLGPVRRYFRKKFHKDAIPMKL